MEKIQHRNVSINGINMHVAEIGEGPAVVFVHGFPELWYSWRHQMLYLSNKGYRAIAPDLRGYGDTDSPPDATNYTVFHIVMKVYADFLSKTVEYLQAGKLKAIEDVSQGVESIPSAFIGLFCGDNIGKKIVKIADE